MTETETATPRNIIHRNQKEVKRTVIRLEDRQLTLYSNSLFSPILQLITIPCLSKCRFYVI